MLQPSAHERCAQDSGSRVRAYPLAPWFLTHDLGLCHISKQTGAGHRRCSPRPSLCASQSAGHTGWALMGAAQATRQPAALRLPIPSGTGPATHPNQMHPWPPASHPAPSPPGLRGLAGGQGSGTCMPAGRTALRLPIAEQGWPEFDRGQRWTHRIAVLTLHLTLHPT